MFSSAVRCLRGEKSMTAKPLTSYPKGSKVTIKNYCAGQQARCRLCAMGPDPGHPGRGRLRRLRPLPA